MRAERPRARRATGVVAAATAGVLLAAPPAGAEAAPSDGGLVRGGVVLTVAGLSRSGGVVTLRLTLANHGEQSQNTTAFTRNFLDPDGCLAYRVLDPATGRAGWPVGQAEGSCRATRPPVSLDAGEQVTLALDLADPGGGVLDVLGVNGGVVPGVAVSGDAAPASSGVTTFAPRAMELNARSAADGTRVRRGKKTAIDLDTDVLFAVDSAKLTARANKTLDTAAAELKKQSGRRVVVSGHTDSTGTSAHNLTLSQQRAAAVQKALAQRLGSGWSFEVKGYGETRPLVPETDASGRVDEAARALNRRVELSVG